MMGGFFLTRVSGRLHETDNKTLRLMWTILCLGTRYNGNGFGCFAVGQVPSTMKGESALNLQYRQGPDLPELKYGYPDSHLSAFLMKPAEPEFTGLVPCVSRWTLTTQNLMLPERSKGHSGDGIARSRQNRHPRVGDLTFPELPLVAVLPANAARKSALWCT
ncbi:MAG: hypothetical protein Ct9H300mP21_02950 [Pseudomonadota bacterium]|nr:MAG: hypothetical protein Ct9H300mP21_02950 [Pseudomonadota bacterium]